MGLTKLSFSIPKGVDNSFNQSRAGGNSFSVRRSRRSEPSDRLTSCLHLWGSKRIEQQNLYVMGLQVAHLNQAFGILGPKSRYFLLA